MTNPDREELVKLADKVRDWTPENRNPLTFIAHERRLIVTALRRLASSDSGVKGEPEPVAWQWRCCIGGNWGAWLELDQPVEQFRSGRWAFNLKNGTAELRALYTAPPADAGMREAYSALCLPRESQASDNLEGALYDIERLSAQGKPTDDICIRTLKRVLKQIVRAEDALTAPGATTKSDGGAKAGSSPILASKEEQRPDTHGMMPVGDNAANVGCTGVGPSDPSSTRSEVTVEELARSLRHLGKTSSSYEAEARALLDQFEIRRK